jgi:hypothetical protein
VSHGDDKEEKQGGWPSHYVVIELPTLPPLSCRDVISPARIVAKVLNDTFVGGKEEGAAMVAAKSNGTTMTTTTLVWMLLRGNWSTTSWQGKDMMGNSDGSYHWWGGTAVGSSFTNDGAMKKKCDNQPNKRLDDFWQEEEDGRTTTGATTATDEGRHRPRVLMNMPSWKPN